MVNYEIIKTLFLYNMSFYANDSFMVSHFIIARSTDTQIYTYSCKNEEYITFFWTLLSIFIDYPYQEISERRGSRGRRR